MRMSARELWNYSKFLLRDEGGWVGAAIIGGVMLYNAYMQSQTAQDASDTQYQAAVAAAQATLQMYYQNQENMAPWLQAGQIGLAGLVGTPAIPAGPETTTYGLPEPQREDFTTTELQPVQVPFGPGDPGITSMQMQPQEVFDEAGYNAAMADYEASATTTPGTAAVPAVPGLLETGPGEYPGTYTPGAGPGEYPGTYTPGAGPGEYPGTYDPGARPGEYEASPYHNWLLAEGTRGLERGAAARGGQLSGAEQKALMEYGQNLAGSERQRWLDNWYREQGFAGTEYQNWLNQYYQGQGFAGTEYQNWLNQYYQGQGFEAQEHQNWLNQYYQGLTPYQSLAGLGMTAGTNIGAAGMQTGQGVSNALLAGGQAQAAGQMGAYAPYANYMNWGANQLAQYYGYGGYGGGGGYGGPQQAGYPSTYGATY